MNYKSKGFWYYQQRLEDFRKKQKLQPEKTEKRWKYWNALKWKALESSEKHCKGLKCIDIIQMYWTVLHATRKSERAVQTMLQNRNRHETFSLIALAKGFLLCVAYSDSPSRALLIRQLNFPFDSPPQFPSKMSLNSPFEGFFTFAFESSFISLFDFPLVPLLKFPLMFLYSSF